MRILSLALKLLPALIIVALWETLILIKPPYEFFMGSPSGVLREAVDLIKAGTLYRDVAVTAFEALLGFLAGSAFGTGFGLGLWYSKPVYGIARPYIVALGAIPVFALGPIIIFWFGTGILSKVVLGFLSTFAIAVVQSYTGASEADQNLQKLLRAFGATRSQIFAKIIVPSSLVWVLLGIRINIGMALLGAFVGEFIASRIGLGHLIVLAEGLYNVNQIWVGIFAILAIAIVFYLATSPIERWARRWQET
jgi:NitT/TauT family transport system permease protein